MILKPLSEAVKDKDTILGILRATAVNENGTTSGLTVPSKDAQMSLIRQALSHAELDPNTIDYVETHGTGTSLGDPIEVSALNDVFSGRTDRPLWLGTVKTNIGHLESAAGIAGVIKTLLALNHEAIPPHLHFKHLNPNISLEVIPAQIPLTLTPWQRSNRPRIAGVSSFGFSGINAHAIIEEPPIVEQKKNTNERPLHLITISAKTKAALDQLIDLYRKHLPEEELADIAFSANTGRSHFSYRNAFIAKNKDEFLNQLQGEMQIHQVPTSILDVVFIFKGLTNEDSDWLNIFPVFTKAMEKSKGLNEYAFFELLKSWGIVPDYVVGEGLEDITAANGAEIITLKEIPKGSIVITPQNNWNDLLQILSQFYLNGIPIDWKAFDKPYSRKKVLLPNYPFQREKYWIEKTKKKRQVTAEAHPLLGELISSLLKEKLFRNEIDLDFLPYLKDHKVFDHIIFPGAGFVELFQVAGNKLFQGQFFTINNLFIEQPFILEAKTQKIVELMAIPNEKAYFSSIYSVEDQAWILHAKAELTVSESIPELNMDWGLLNKQCQQSIDVEYLYNRYAAIGLHYGKQFQTLRKLWVGNNEVLAELEGETSVALIDGSLQAMAALLQKEHENSIYLPLSIDRITYFEEIRNSIRMHGKLIEHSDNGFNAEITLFSYDGKALMKIEGFRARKTDHAHLQHVLDAQPALGVFSWFYQIDWYPKPIEKKDEELKGSWLIVSEEKEEVGGFNGRFINPEQAFTQVQDNLPEGVIWFASGKNSLKHAFEFVQALDKLDTKPRLYFITRGIQPIGPITNLENTPFNGFFKTLKIEMPTLESRHIDLSTYESLPHEELLATDKEDQVAYRQGIRYIPRLVNKKNVQKFVENPLKIDSKGSYLITGGLGGLGLKCAEWLARQGAKHLILAGRKTRAIAIAESVVETVVLDVSQKSAVEELMQKFGKEWPELKGIIHAAGVLDDGIISSQDWSRFVRVLAPKVQGSWNLHEASLNKPLDFFVLFSSVASSIGSPGQINYSSANAYMDALAYFRQEKGLPALSINWGPWAEVGLASQLTDRHHGTGFIAFKPEEGIKAFELALKQKILK